MNTDTPGTLPAPIPMTTPAHTPGGAELDSLSLLMERLEAAIGAGQPCEVHVQRIEGTRRVPVAKIDGAAFDVYELGTAYGAGNYMLRLRTGGRWNGAATVQADAPPQTAPRKTPPDVARAEGVGGFFSPAPPAPQVFDQNQLLATIFGMMQQGQTNMMQMMQMQAQQSTAIITAVMGKAEKSNVGELIDGLKSLQEISGESGGGGDGDLGAMASLFNNAMTMKQKEEELARRMGANRAQTRRLAARRLVRGPQLAGRTAPAPAHAKPRAAAPPAPQTNTSDKLVRIAEMSVRMRFSPSVCAKMMSAAIAEAADGPQLVMMLPALSDDDLITTLLSNSKGVSDDYARSLVSQLRAEVAKMTDGDDDEEDDDFEDDDEPEEGDDFEDDEEDGDDDDDEEDDDDVEMVARENQSAARAAPSIVDAVTKPADAPAA